MVQKKASSSGKRLNKAAFVRRHAERHNLVRVTASGRRDLCIKAANSEVVRVLDSIVRETVGGNSIVVTGFGTIEVIEHSPRNARNPQTGEIVGVPKRRDVKLVLGENYKDFLNKRRKLPQKGVIAVGKAPKGTAPSATTLRRRASRAAAAKK